MNTQLPHITLGAAVLAAAVTAGGFAWQDAAERKPQAKADEQPPKGAPHQGQQMPDLISALKNSEGCLGVDVGQMMSGKRVIFSWFEDKDAVSNWYYSEPHQQVMDMFFQETTPDFKPLQGVPEDAGPFLVIASLTPAEQGEIQGTSLPVSQIAIEIYEPVTGGLSLGGRFAPEGVKVKDMHHYTQDGTKTDE